MQKIIFILFCATTLLGCKKDRLVEDKEILIGKWNWSYTWHISDICNLSGIGPVDTLTTDTQGDTYSVEFLKKGKLLFYKNGQVDEKKRIVFSDWSVSNYDNWLYDFGIFLNNDPDNGISCLVSKDTLFVKGYPFNQKDCNDCCLYSNYFVRE